MPQRFMRFVMTLAVLCALTGVAACIQQNGKASAADIPAAGGNAEGKVYSKDMLFGKITAPEFPAQAQWLNTDGPLKLADLRGKVVLLDFWTYCCINCMHVIPDLKQLEGDFPDSLVVIGVHSAKFENEQETGNIRNAVLRYEVEHPVVNDADMRIWDEYTIHSWPSFVLIDPQGKIIGQTSGEGVYAKLHGLIAAVVEAQDKAGNLKRSTPHWALERDKRPATLLSFPGKLAVDEAGGRLFISDSNHHRIVVAGLDGQVQAIIGSGTEGLKDGAFDEAQFHRPQGMAYDAETNWLYIADTENHALRRADLKAGTVETLLGDGQQADWGQLGDRLSSPWDLALLDGTLYIAMAGSHQLYSVSTASGKLELFAGSGSENIVNAPLLQAALAQPSGITTDGTGLFFADSEVSAVRSATLGPQGRVTTLVGKGLFDFGDIDGKWDLAKLQHCIGVDYHDGAVYVADSYNHKVKRLDIQARTSETVVGTGKSGYSDGAAATAQLAEPNDVAWAKGVMYIADTNNSLIRTFDPQTKTVGTFMLRGLDKLAASMPPTAPGKAGSALPAQQLPLAGGTLRFSFKLPAGTHLNELQAPIVKASSDNPAVHFGAAVLGNDGRLSIPVNVDSGAAASATLTIELGVFYCDLAGTGQCYLDNPTLSLPLTLSTGAPATAELEYTVKM